MLDACCKSPELDVFKSESICDLLDFKWSTYAVRFHMFGCTMHFAYMFLLFVYVSQIYINNNEENKLLFDMILCCGLLYPLFYELY